VNVHASLLPNYRGAAPINWAIINGEKETGVTTFKLTHEIDTGNILLQEKVPIHDNDDAGNLHDRLKNAGALLLLKTIEGMINDTVSEKPQEMILQQDQTTALTHAPKIFTETCRIDWQAPIEKIHNLVRGLSPFPGAFTNINDKTLKIFRSMIERTAPLLPPGQYETDHKKYLRFAASDGYLYINELQLEGKRRMTVEEFLKGFRS
jgi:methionyl-tRNA formyltransferase